MSGKVLKIPKVIRKIRRNRKRRMIQLGQLSIALGAEFGPTRLLIPGARRKLDIANNTNFIEFTQLMNKTISYAFARDEGSTECGYCGSVCSTRRTALKHITMKHNGDPRKFLCHCGGAFTTKGNLKKHLKNAKVHKPRQNKKKRARKPRMHKPKGRPK